MSINTRLPKFLSKLYNEIYAIENNSIEKVIETYKQFLLVKENSFYYNLLDEKYKARFEKENVNINKI